MLDYRAKLKKKSEPQARFLNPEIGNKFKCPDSEMLSLWQLPFTLKEAARGSAPENKVSYWGTSLKIDNSEKEDPQQEHRMIVTLREEKKSWSEKQRHVTVTLLTVIKQ